MTPERFQVFISGTFAGMQQYREAALEACLRVGVSPLALEHLEATEESLSRTIGDLLDKADIYLGIIGDMRGALSEGGKSFTELEYELAGEKGIPRLVFARVGGAGMEHTMATESDLRITAFKNAVRQGGLVSTFRSVEEFKSQVLAALVDVVRALSRDAKPKSAVLLIPYGERWSSIRTFVETTLQTEGLLVSSFDEISPGASWANAMADALFKADVVVADITGANPNVMYELGLAHSLRKPTIILVETDAMNAVPFDVGAYNLLSYDRDSLQGLQKPLARFLQEYTREEWRR